MQHEQRRRRVAGDVDRQRRDELGEAVEVEARAVGQRRQPGQVLIARLERAAGTQVEDRIPAARAGPREVERETEHEGERQHPGRERRRAIGRADQTRREHDREHDRSDRDERERMQARSPDHHEGWRRGTQPAVEVADQQPGDDGRRGAEDDDSRNDVRCADRGRRCVGSCGHAPTPEPLARGRAGRAGRLRLGDRARAAAGGGAAALAGPGARPGRRGSPRSATVPKASCPTRPAVWSPWRCAIRPCSRWSTLPPASCAGASFCRARRAISRSRVPAARCWRRPSRPTACSRSRSPTGRSAAACASAPTPTT